MDGVLNPSLARDIIEGIRAKLRSLKSQGYIIGADCWLDEAVNDNDSLTLSGVLLPEVIGGRLSLLALEQMAELGKAWPLIEGSGTIYGMFVIVSLSQTETEFFESGMPRRIEFTLTLKRMDESLCDMFGSISDQLSNLQDTAASSALPLGKLKIWWEVCCHESEYRSAGQPGL